MTLQQIRYVAEIARHGTISKAAQELYITQPHLSSVLKELENELGITIFSRARKGVVLTEDGMLLRRRAQEIVELADKAERELQHHEEELTGEVAIGCGETAAMTFLSEHIRTFRRQHPLVQFRIYSAIADDVKERIEKGLLDMGLLAEPVDIGRYAFLRQIGWNYVIFNSLVSIRSAARWPGSIRWRKKKPSRRKADGQRGSFFDLRMKQRNVRRYVTLLLLFALVWRLPESRLSYR